MPRVSSRIRNCSIYLYETAEDARKGRRTGGSGFIVGVPYSDDVSAHGHHLYAVTCWHVVNPHVGNSPIVRIGRRDGGVDVLPLCNDDWIQHQDGDDLAICPLELTEDHVPQFIEPTGFVREDAQFVDDDGSDLLGEFLGREVIVVGRLMGHDGKQTNRPALRFGNVAMVPGEPIEIGGGLLQEAFLVDARSISGASGSPVFLLPDLWTKLNRIVAELSTSGRVELARDVPEIIQFGYTPLLLGIDFCHIRLKEGVRDGLGNKLEDGMHVRRNTGMMGVIPAWRLLSALYDPEVESLRQEVEKKMPRTSNVSLDIRREKG